MALSTMELKFGVTKYPQFETSTRTRNSRVGFLVIYVVNLSNMLQISFRAEAISFPPCCEIVVHSNMHVAASDLMRKMQHTKVYYVSIGDLRGYHFLWNGESQISSES